MVTEELAQELMEDLPEDLTEGPNPRRSARRGPRKDVLRKPQLAKQAGHTTEARDFEVILEAPAEWAGSPRKPSESGSRSRLDL